VLNGVMAAITFELLLLHLLDMASCIIHGIVQQL
jgi:hypothetical protein